MTRVDLIVSTFNQPELLASCLKSLQRQTFQDFRLIVADDHSEPPPHEIVRGSFPAATIVRSKRNCGLVRCLNAAMGVGDSEFVVLLNDDTEQEPDWLEILVRTADSRPECGSIASKLLIHGSPRVIHSAGDAYTTWGMPANRGVWLPDLGQYDDRPEIFSACGGAALYRRTALEAVQLGPGIYLDPQLYMYCEDIDIGWRLQLAGFPCALAPDAVVHHHLSATGGGKLASYYVSRNVLLLLVKSVPDAYWRDFWPRILAHHAGRLARMLVKVREPATRASLRGAISGMVLGAIAFRSRDGGTLGSEYERVRRILIDRP